MTFSVTSFRCLLAAHLLGDFPLQTDAMVRAKNGGSGAPLICHAAIHALLAALFLLIFPPWYLLAAVLLTVFSTHWAIDRWFKPLVLPASIRDEADQWPWKTLVFALDQVLHVAVLGLLVVLAQCIAPAATPWGLGETRAFDRSLVQLCGFIMAVWVGGVLIGYRLEPLVKELSSLPGGFKEAGKLIGTLERSLVYQFVIIGQYSAIGFLLTAKSILRFGEIKSDADGRKQPEYVLIGTLMSVAWAIAAGLLTLKVLSILPADAARNSAAASTPPPSSLRP